MSDGGDGILGTWRPHTNLMKYYALESLLAGPFFPIVLIARYLRFRTLNYVIDEEGVRMSWGVLFRREASLTYERIQDIHLTSNLVQRHLGLGRVQIQTASGTSRAEVTIEGLREFERIRDYLYSRMRGVSTLRRDDPPDVGSDSQDGEVARVLREIVAEVGALRRELSDRKARG